MITDKNCLYILEKLESSGFEAYPVGGCVRDMLMNRIPHDFDIATNALPDQITEVFSADKVIPTGIKHGTVTVLKNGMPFEVTTFRIDGKYSDSRRPDNVSFTNDLRADLARRDFTVNAVAMDSKGNIFDPFNGRKDIENRIIRCVGDPEERFSEDALRILRSLRFSSVLDFQIEENTAAAALRQKDRLGSISSERISAELIKLLSGVNCVDVMLRFRDMIGQIIPELIPCFDFDQRSRYHKYTVYEHTVRAVNAIPSRVNGENTLRLAMLLHDVGKPEMFTLDENGFGHFKGHAKASADKARLILKRLKFDNKTITAVCEIISRHSDKIVSEKQIKRIMSSIGLDGFLMLIEAKKADNAAKQEFVLAENAEFDRFAETARQLAAEKSCISLADMAVNGSDLISLGFKGREIGVCLRALLELIIDEVLTNDRTALLKRAKEMKK
ncbi:MAG: CCA tRNA nucleotidyltransferase [Ruminococcus sp.]|nr:CCA tRNA nucleotidyltransferase [Ruminococcus sp.]